MTRHPIEAVCGRCGAQPGFRCIGSRGQERTAFHKERGSKRAKRCSYSTDQHRTESPIENMMVGAISAWIDHHGVTATVSTQVALGPFRLDIVVTSRGRHLVVECDGAKFHSSPAAVERDKRRDRYCACAGMFVMRFTGVEIMRDPRGCAAQVGVWIMAQ